MAGITWTGTDNDDTKVGTDEKDTLNGGKGDDTLTGKLGNDTITGGDGDDTIYGGRADTNEDLAVLTTNPSLTDNDIIFGGAGNDDIKGGLGDDIIFGGDGHDTLNGGEGNDIIFGGAGVDTIFGWDGDDRIIGGGGVGGVGRGSYNNLYGGEGNDTFVFKVGDGLYNSIRDFTDGDKIEFIGLKFSDLTIEHGNYAGGTQYRYAKITFGDGDVVWVNGTVSGKGLVRDLKKSDFIFKARDKNDFHMMEATEGADTLGGSTERDKFNGGDGDDTVDGGAGNDKLRGDAGDDTLTGGDGNDHLRGGGRATIRSTAAPVTTS